MWEIERVMQRGDTDGMTVREVHLALVHAGIEYLTENRIRQLMNEMTNEVHNILRRKVKHAPPVVYQLKNLKPVQMELQSSAHTRPEPS